jgi:excisionase family DNA binding protein
LLTWYETLFARQGGDRMAKRFIQLSDVSEILDISSTQAYALVRSGELTAIKVGGRGQWRVEVSELENYIQRMYSETKTFVASHPFGLNAADPESSESPE